jgi:hypothetical protein
MTDKLKEDLFHNGFENWHWLDTMVKDRTSIFIDEEWSDEEFKVFRLGAIYTYSNSSGRMLVSGAEVYPYAICVCAKPLVLISESGDMMWRNNDEQYLVEVKNLNVDTGNAFKRYRREYDGSIFIREEV